MGNKEITTIGLIDFPINFPSYIAAVVVSLLILLMTLLRARFSIISINNIIELKKTRRVLG